MWVGIYKRSGTAYIGSIPPSPPPQFHHNHSTPLHKSTTDRLEPLLPLFLPPRATIVGCSPFLTPNPTLLIPQPFSLLICNPTLPTHQRKTQKIYLSRFVGKKRNIFTKYFHPLFLIATRLIPTLTQLQGSLELFISLALKLLLFRRSDMQKLVIGSGVFEYSELPFSSAPNAKCMKKKF